MNLIQFLTMVLHICSQNYLFGERPTQCIKLVREAGAMAHELKLEARPLNELGREDEFQTWTTARTRTIDKDCGPMKNLQPYEYSVCKAGIVRYFDALYFQYFQATKGVKTKDIVGEIK